MSKGSQTFAGVRAANAGTSPEPVILSSRPAGFTTDGASAGTQSDGDIQHIDSVEQGKS
jgi:hypothetical protein